MNISKAELLRIAQICKLSFSDEELEHLRQSIENTIEESRQLFETGDSCSCDGDYHDAPQVDLLLEIAKESFSYCSAKLDKA